MKMDVNVIVPCNLLELEALALRRGFVDHVLLQLLYLTIVLICWGIIRENDVRHADHHFLSCAEEMQFLQSQGGSEGRFYECYSEANPVKVRPNCQEDCHLDQ